MNAWDFSSYVAMSTLCCGTNEEVSASFGVASNAEPSAASRTPSGNVPELSTHFSTASRSRVLCCATTHRRSRRRNTLSNCFLSKALGFKWKDCKDNSFSKSFSCLIAARLAVNLLFFRTRSAFRACCVRNVRSRGLSALAFCLGLDRGPGHNLRFLPEPAHPRHSHS